MTDMTVRIEYMPLAKLKKWPRNPKDHDIGQIHQSIGRFGYVQPVMVDERSGMLVAGHGRLETLEQMRAEGKTPPERVETNKKGEWFVPVIRGVRFANDQEAAAYAVADNRLAELGGWDDAALVDVLKDLNENDALTGVGFDADDLDEMLTRTDGKEFGGISSKVLPPPEIVWVLAMLPLASMPKAQHHIDGLSSVDGARVEVSIGDKD